MIKNGNRMMWVDPLSNHRRLVIDQLQLFSETPNYQTIDGGDAFGKWVADYQDYDLQCFNHLKEISRIFRRQFDNKSYRRCSNSKIELTRDGKCIAYANNSGIKISRSMVFALDDMWQSVVSDNHTDLHFFGGAAFQGNNDVLRNVDHFNSFDQVRFFDYSFLRKIGEMRDKGDFSHSEYAKIHSVTCAKMLSKDRPRVELGGLLSDLSLNWIMAHEDAHIYLGHTDYFCNELGITGTELEDADDDLLNLISNHSSNSASDDTYSLRYLVELHADEMACLRMVDYYFDKETFAIIPGLEKAAIKLSEIMEDGGAQEKLGRARSIVLLRVIIASAIGALFLFYRKIEKTKARDFDYPSIEVRISNAIFYTLLRVAQRLNIVGESASHRLIWPSVDDILILNSGICSDIQVIAWNLMCHPILLRDPDFPRGKEFNFVDMDDFLFEENPEIKFLNLNIGFFLAIAAPETVDNNFGERAVLAASTNEHIRNMIFARSKYYSEFKDKFLPIMNEKFPHNSDKHAENIAQIKTQSEHCDTIIKYWRDNRRV